MVSELVQVAYLPHCTAIEAAVGGLQGHRLDSLVHHYMALQTVFHFGIQTGDELAVDSR